MTLEVQPVTPDRWNDFQKVMGPNGAYAGCWCMWWRLGSRKQWEGTAKERGPRMKRAMKRLVDKGTAPGVLAYVDGEPAMWCSIAPREDYSALERSKNYARIDDTPVWSVVCFYAAKQYRGQGMLADVLRAACEYARDNGARVIEGYPVAPDKKMAAVDVYMGTAEIFRRAGFKEVGRTRNGKPVMRRSMRRKAA